MFKDFDYISPELDQDKDGIAIDADHDAADSRGLPDDMQDLRIRGYGD